MFRGVDEGLAIDDSLLGGEGQGVSSCARPANNFVFFRQKFDAKDSSEGGSLRLDSVDSVGGIEKDDRARKGSSQDGAAIELGA